MSRRSAGGFTLVELVLVIVITGILAATILTRFDVQDFRRQGFYEQALAAARYAHKVAIASGCDVRFQLDATGFRLDQRAGCTGAGAFSVAILDPGKGASAPFAEAAPDGAAVTTGADLYFNTLGQPSMAATPNIGGRQFTIEAETGFVHP